MSKGISDEQKEENRQLYPSMRHHSRSTRAEIRIDETENMADCEQSEPRRR